MIDRSATTISADDVVDRLKRNLAYHTIVRKIAAQQAIDRAARERGISVDPDAIQAEAERIRLENRLEKAADTLKWLSDRTISVEDWEAGISDRLLSKALAEDLFESEVKSYFAQNKLNYDRLILYRIVVPYETLAQEIFYQIEEEEISFYEAAHLYDINEKRRYCCGFEGKVYRWSLSPDIAPALWSANVGEIIGPLQIEEQYHLFLIEEFIPAELKPEIHQAIIDKLFKEWLERELQYIFDR
ncbi:peptidylprolyl isomerase [Synechococcus sp. PCC 7336]|uniref:peptidylprolyl isomerase n=1 Tax=Synechococcus sp. PCC 7336 TaxID=195250 RepID=UPI00034A011A|nr:peptidylprolyl isomerase [Synechococcus sp. PCC 7336]